MTRLFAQLVGLLLLPLLLVACERRPNSANATPKETIAVRQPAVEPATRVNLWERARQCADQAEKVIARIERRHGGDPQAPGLLGWENHYNSQLERCYIRATYQNRNADRKAGIPILYEELGDAFENSVVASVGTGVPNDSMFCWVKDGAVDSSGNCAAARAHVEDRMSK
jgi:hypothetical protein